MRRIVSILLAAVLLIGAAQILPSAAAEEITFQFNRENFPKLDGSTSLVPLGNGIASVLLGESREDCADLISFNRTTQSFRNLREGYCDIVIAAEPKSDVFEEMRMEAFPYLMETIATEALVFVVNENNPVSSLTTQQVRDIYSGKITNWKEVGGEDLPIEAFQRNPGAGSQVMMEKLVMDGTPMMEAPSTMIPQEMGELIDAVRSFDNSANAIGYTVYYYASDMQMAKGLKILKIDGVLPSADTLRSREYPYLNGYYCCISAAAAADSPERILYDWLVSDAGQALLTLEGYVSVYAPGEAPASGENVTTDYAAYSPNGGIAAQFTLFDCPHDHLEPSGDYGLIYPYTGALLYSTWDGNSQDYRSGAMQGFYTHKGELITNPVYTGISQYTFGERPGEDYFWVISNGPDQCGIAAKDGSVVSGMEYTSVRIVGDQILCIRDYLGCIFDLYDKDFNLIKTQEDFYIDERYVMPVEHAAGMYTCETPEEDWSKTLFYLVDEEETVLLKEENYIDLQQDGTVITHTDSWDCLAYDKNLHPILFGDMHQVNDIMKLGSKFYRVQGMDGSDLVTDRSGTLFEWGYEMLRIYPDDSFGLTSNGRTRIYDPSGRRLYTDIPENWEYLGCDGIFSEDGQDVLILHKLPGGESVTIPGGGYVFECGEVFGVCIRTESGWYYRIMDKEFNLLPGEYSDLTWTVDPFTGERMLMTYDAYGFSGEQRLISSDGQSEIYRANAGLGLQGGCITSISDWAFSCMDQDGSVIFCYPFYGMGSGD